VFPKVLAGPEKGSKKREELPELRNRARVFFRIGGEMVGELDILTEWIPEQMSPGTIFVLENAGKVGESADPYWAVLSCPSCGTLGLITRKQIAGLLPVICGSEKCAAQFFINDSEIVLRKPF
jgi:hypothetical protein